MSIQQMLLGGSPSGYNLTRSLRFRASASAYLNRTQSNSGGGNRWTYSSWLKRGALGVGSRLLCTSSGVGATNSLAEIYFDGSDRLGFFQFNGGTTYTNLITTQVFRDPSAWYHIVVSYDDTQATSTNRVKFYVNGVQVTAFSTASYPSQNFNSFFNTSTNPVWIGVYIGNSLYLDGYLAEVNFIDGQALTPSSFGSTNALTGVWQPAPYTGTYGTNGFYLPFTSNSTAAALGTDFSGNSNTWTTNNISVTAGVTYDSMTDVPTLTSATASNYCVGNPLSVGANTSLSNGNLSGTLTGSGGWAGTIGGLTSGKWYYEATVTANSGNSMWVGFLSDVYTLNNNAWAFSTQVALYANDGRNGNNAAYGATWTTNDVIGIALDISTSSGSVTFYKNGVSQGVMFSSLTSSAVWRPLISGGGTGTTIAMNFGQRPFSYTPPTGYASLNTFNLPAATIVKGDTVMDATLYTGNGSTQTITNAASFQPDLVWVKSRSVARDHRLVDSVRGATRNVRSNTTNAEDIETNGLLSFNANGFNVGSNAGFNENAATLVGWQWQAGQGSSGSNTNGTITSTVSVNAAAGFSVVTYTGTGANATVGHGLGVAPKMVIVKRRNTTGDWYVYHTSIVAANTIYLNLTNGSTNSPTTWNSTAPTSSVFSVGTNAATNGNTNTFVAYCWSEIDGFSKFGSYTGNGSADGTFVYTGFRPKFVLIKRTSAAGNFWRIWDSSRSPYNLGAPELYPNVLDVEGSEAYDLLSNGFKIRTTGVGINASSATYLFAAFAENPLKYALAR